MPDIFLSQESYDILQQFNARSSIPDESLRKYPESCIQQLCDYGLIESHIKDYDESNHFSPVCSDYAITELGKGYLLGRKNDEEFLSSVKSMAESASKQALHAEEIAASSKKQSETAEYVAHKADVKGWIAIFISFAALGIEIIANLDKILFFLKLII